MIAGLHLPEEKVSGCKALILSLYGQGTNLWHFRLISTPPNQPDKAEEKLKTSTFTKTHLRTNTFGTFVPTEGKYNSIQG